MKNPAIPVLVSLILIGCKVLSVCAVIRPVTIGGVLDSEENIKFFKDTVERLNTDTVNPPPRDIHFNSTAIIFQENPIRTAKAVCESVITKQVYVVIANHPFQSNTPPMAISYTCGFYKIPVIGISVRESIFSDMNVHGSFIRTVPPYSEQAVVWVELIKHFKWPSMIIIHSVDQEGRTMLGQLQNHADALAKDYSIEIEKSVKYVSGQSNYSQELTELMDLQSRVVLLYATEEDARNIYSAAISLGLIGSGYVWIVTEQALLPENTPYGVIGTQLENSNEHDHIEDCVTLIGKAFNNMLALSNITEDPPRQCSNQIWEFGKKLFKDITETVLENGKTGRVQFNENGDRVNSVYKIVNYKPGKGMVTIGKYSNILPAKLHMNNEPISWLGNETAKPKGVKISTHLKVVTIKEKPFVYIEEYNPETCNIEQKKVLCPHKNTTTEEKIQYCCFGYAIDLLIKLSEKINFTYDVHLVEDGAYGSYERVNNTRIWTGMVGEIVDGKADLIVAPLTINPERAEHIDFSKPFKYQGLTILVRKTPKDSSLASFLQPFQDTLWILVMLSVHVVALVLYLLDRFSPFGRFKLAKSDDTEEDALNLSSAMWFAWGVLLNSGIGEGTPRSFSARVLGMVWAGFAMIIVASYTANLAAFLVLDRPEASISGIDDARLRNPQEDFRYATVKNSSVAMYFKRQVELSTMYRTMETRNYGTPDEAIQDVKDSKLQAFIWDSSRLEYEAANHCELVTAGELFGRSGYGIGLPKNSPWTREISLSILNYHESGAMEELDGKWILVKDTKCPEKDTSPATLGLTNMAGVFMMVAGGIVAGVFLIFIEIAYKRHRGLKEKELELAKTAADRWRGNIEKRKILRRSWQMMKEGDMKRRTLRRTLLQQQQERKSNGTNENTALNTVKPAVPPRFTESVGFTGRLPANSAGPTRNRSTFSAPGYEENAV